MNKLEEAVERAAVKGLTEMAMAPLGGGWWLVPGVAPERHGDEIVLGEPVLYCFPLGERLDGGASEEGER